MADVNIQRNISLASYSSWQVGGNAEFFVQPTTVEELKDAVHWAGKNAQPVTVLGGGTNVLISDKGVRGLVIVLRKLAGSQAQVLTVGEIRASDGDSQSQIFERLIIECLAGTSKSEVLKIFLKYKLAPALFLAGLPGDVGGGVAMNAGVGEVTTPREFVEIVDWVEVLRWDTLPDKEYPDPNGNLRLEKILADRLQWSYRHCGGWRPGIITRVGLSWPMNPDLDVLQKVRQANQVRLSKQPLDMPSCGSVFVNPDGFKSGQLIEQAGLKGWSHGGAKVSEKHANFIVNFNKATANDIHQVIEHVRSTVHQKFNIRLHTEVVYIGDW